MAKLITPFCEENKAPIVHSDAFVDRTQPASSVMSSLKRGKHLAMVVIRADSEKIRIKKNSAILDFSLVEAPTKHPVMIDEEALISHRVVIHGAHVPKKSPYWYWRYYHDGTVISLRLYQRSWKCCSAC